MAYPANRHFRDRRENKVQPDSRQGRFSVIPNPAKRKEEITPFGTRLKEAFRGTSQREIAEKLEVSETTISEYMYGDSHPTFQGLLKIQEITNCNLHYLLTGRSDPGGTLEALGEVERECVLEVARIYNLDENVVINDLIREGLLARCVEAVTRLIHLQGDEREEFEILRALLRIQPTVKDGKLLR